jgi:high affinity choline transporter 7
MGVKLTAAILLAALVVTLYTMIGGLWSVAYTDMFQLGLVAVGLLAALPFVLDSTGGLHSTLTNYQAARPHGAALLPPMGARAGAWTVPGIWNWWDVAFMLMLGGIPWNCYFQRVLSCRTPAKRAENVDQLGDAHDGFRGAPAAHRNGGPHLRVARTGINS